MKRQILISNDEGEIIDLLKPKPMITPSESEALTDLIVRRMNAATPELYKEADDAVQGMYAMLSAREEQLKSEAGMSQEEKLDMLRDHIATNGMKGIWTHKRVKEEKLDESVDFIRPPEPEWDDEDEADTIRRTW